MRQTKKFPVPAFERRWALFLDVDGTLIGFVEHPDRLKASPELIDALRRVDRWTEGAVALVSGRSISSVDAIFAPLRLPIAGLHGHERRDKFGKVHRAPLEQVEARALSRARERFETLVASHPGAFVEEKGAGIALHYRRVPAAAREAEEIASDLEKELPKPLCVQRGKMVVEIRSCLHSKGSAIEAFMSEPPFEGRIPVFVGDDATDEHGFRWINEHGGLSIKVGPGRTEARFRFEDVAQVMDWLQRYVRFLEDGESVGGHAR